MVRNTDTPNMAPVKGFTGAEVEVLVGGKPVREYYVLNEESSDPRKLVYYIEAKDGQVFDVRQHIRSGIKFSGDAISTDVRIDGNWVGGRIFYEVDSESGEGSTYICEGPASGKKGQKFCFNTLQMSEAENYFAGEEDLLKDVGVIAVDFYHAKVVTVTRKKSRAPASADPEPSPDLGVLSEKAVVKCAKKKEEQPLSHTGGYTPGEASMPAIGATVAPGDTTTTTKDYPLDDREKCTVEFRYRNIGAIKSMLDDADIVNLPTKKLVLWQQQLTPRKKFVPSPGTEIVELD